MSNLKDGIIAAVVALVVALGVTIVSHQSPASLPNGLLADAGLPGTLAGATASTLSSTLFSHLTNLEVNSNFGVVGTIFQGAAGETGSPLQSYVVPGTCNTGTSTVFAEANPFNATSTVSLERISGVGQATSTNLSVGTSTKSTGITSTTISPTLINAATIGTSSPGFDMAGGITAGGVAQGATGSGSGTFTKILIGPKEFIVGFATSTYGNAGAVGYSPALTSCSYKIKWQS